LEKGDRKKSGLDKEAVNNLREGTEKREIKIEFDFRAMQRGELWSIGKGRMPSGCCPPSEIVCRRSSKKGPKIRLPPRGVRAASDASRKKVAAKKKWNEEGSDSQGGGPLPGGKECVRWKVSDQSPTKKGRIETSGDLKGLKSRRRVTRKQKTISLEQPK